MAQQVWTPLGNVGHKGRGQSVLKDKRGCVLIGLHYSVLYSPPPTAVNVTAANRHRILSSPPECEPIRSKQWQGGCVLMKMHS